MDPRERAFRAVVRRVADEARARHGWTHVDLRLVRDAQGVLTLEGTVAVHRLARRVEEALAQVAPAALRIVSRWTLVQPASWHAIVPGGTRLFSGNTAEAALATTLPADVGPVGVLASTGSRSVVRARDGTTGWCLAEDLGAPTEAPALERPSVVEPGPWIEHSRRHLGTAYRLGGADVAGFDCSGFVAFTARRSSGLWLPRHSGDQRRISQAGAQRPRAGSLSFVWTTEERAGHVGLVTQTGSVIHASATRGRVVEDDWSRWTRDAVRIEHVSWDPILGFGRQRAGLPTLADGFELGASTSDGRRTGD